MKNLLILFISASFLFAGCSGNNQTNNTSGSSGIDVTPDQLTSTIDPVCQMSLEQHAIADTVHYQNDIFGFCSAGCKEAFLADPGQFVEN